MSNIAVEPTEVRSSVTIDTTAKGLALVRVKCYQDVTREEMDRLKDLAVDTYNKTLALLGARATFS